MTVDRAETREVLKAYLALTLSAAQKALKAVEDDRATDFDIAVLTQTVEGNACRADLQAVRLLNNPEVAN